MPNCRSAVSAAIGCATVLIAVNASPAFCQDYPSRPITMFTTEAGGVLDIVARLLAQGISAPLGASVLVDNRPPNLTPDLLLRAPADGYTLAIGGSIFWLAPLTEKVDFNPTRDFAPITLLATYPNVLITSPSLQVTSVKDLIALAKSKPGSLNIGATGSSGAPTYLGAKLLQSMGNVDMAMVPYKGTSQALIAIIRGDVDAMLIAPTLAMPNVKAGKIKALAVTSLAPSALAPGLPTVAATGLPGYEVVSLVGALARSGTSPSIINRLNQEITRVMVRPDVKDRLLNEGAEATNSTPAEFSAKINSEIAKWGKVIKDAGIKTEE